MAEPRLWTTNALSVEFHINNKTMAKRLEGLEPNYQDKGIKYYLLIDVWRHIIEKEEGILDAKKVTAELNNARKEKVEFETEIMKGNYVSVEEMEQLIAEPVINAKQKLLGMATKIASLVPAITTVEEAQRVIGDEVRAALDEIADGKLETGVESPTEDESKRVGRQ